MILSYDEFKEYGYKVKVAMTGYGVSAQEANEIFSLTEIMKEYTNNPRDFELLEPELMAFSMMVGENLRMTLSQLHLTS